MLLCFEPSWGLAMRYVTRMPFISKVLEDENIGRPCTGKGLQFPQLLYYSFLRLNQVGGLQCKSLRTCLSFVCLLLKE